MQTEAGVGTSLPRWRQEAWGSMCQNLELGVAASGPHVLSYCRLSHHLKCLRLCRPWTAARRGCKS